MNDKDKTLVLTLEHINLSFNSVQVLKDASFSVREQEIHAIVGKNGAGKSSLMKVLSGVYTPDSGRVRFLQDGVESHNSPSMRDQGYAQVAMVYQDLSLVSSLSVLQNLFLISHPCKKYGFLDDKRASSSARKILDEIGLSHLDVYAAVSSLSVGEAQLLEIAKAISSQPKVLVLDEPTASLSNIEITKLFEIIRKLRSQGISIIYITHYLEDVMTLCDRVTVLRNACVISTKDIHSTKMSEIISDMLGEDEEALSKKYIKRKDTELKDEDKTPVLELIDASSPKIGPVSLQAYAGDIIGIAGLLGSGRTELFNMLYGLDPLESGSLRINGKVITIKSSEAAKKHGIALVPEERRSQGLVLDFSLAENIAIPNLSQLSKKIFLDIKKLFQLATQMISLLLIKASSETQVVRYLSGGNQQKVVIAKCLASNPKILLLDDPTFGVDIHAKKEIMKIIYDYAQSGNVVLFNSSEFSEISNFCERIYILKKGKIINHVINEEMNEKELVALVQ